MEFEFDKMSSLHEHSPDDFEMKREQLIEEYINSLPSEDQRRRARGVQFKISTQLDLCKDSTSRMNKMVSLFWKGFGEFKDAVQGNLEPLHPENSRVIEVDFSNKGEIK